MKVKEIIEILNENNVSVDAQDLLDLLDNIGYEGANIESDVDMNDVKKLSKRYKVEIITPAESPIIAAAAIFGNGIPLLIANFVNSRPSPSFPTDSIICETAVGLMF